MKVPFLTRYWILRNVISAVADFVFDESISSHHLIPFTPLINCHLILVTLLISSHLSLSHLIAACLISSLGYQLSVAVHSSMDNVRNKEEEQIWVKRLQRSER